MYIYTLAFIRKGNEVLLLNRNKQPWLGCWNGVGGKRLPNESSIECIQREVMEETSIEVPLDQIIDKGTVTWNSFDALGQGLHVFLIELEEDYRYDTPRRVREGILEFKEISFLRDQKNYGIAHNIPYFIDAVLFEDVRYEHRCFFEGDKLLKVERKLL